MRSGAPNGPRRCDSAPTSRRSPSRTRSTGRTWARSTTSCCGAATASRRTTSRSSWTTPTRASTRWSAATTCWPPRLGRPTSPLSSGAAPPTYVHVPLALNAAGHRLAKRDGAVTLARAEQRRHRRVRPHRRLARPHGIDTAGAARVVRPGNAADRAVGLRAAGLVLVDERLEQVADGLWLLDRAGVTRIGHDLEA